MWSCWQIPDKGCGNRSERFLVCFWQMRGPEPSLARAVEAGTTALSRSSPLAKRCSSGSPLSESCMIQSASNGKTWVDIDKQGQLSKWVTLRACSVLKAVYG